MDDGLWPSSGIEHLCNLSTLHGKTNVFCRGDWVGKQRFHRSRLHDAHILCRVDEMCAFARSDLGQPRRKRRDRNVPSVIVVVGARGSAVRTLGVAQIVLYYAGGLFPKSHEKGRGCFTP